MRRLLMISKALGFEEILLVTHDTSPSSWLTRREWYLCWHTLSTDHCACLRAALIEYEPSEVQRNEIVLLLVNAHQFRPSDIEFRTVLVTNFPVGTIESPSPSRGSRF